MILHELARTQPAPTVTLPLREQIANVAKSRSAGGRPEAVLTVNTCSQLQSKGEREAGWRIRIYIRRRKGVLSSEARADF